MTTTAVVRCLQLPARPDSPRTARRAVAEVLATCGRAEWSGDAELAVTELVTNSVIHAHTPLVLNIVFETGCLRVEVRDFNPALPAVRSYEPDASTGRGMALVAALSSDFGVEPTDDGKCVWFTISATTPPTGTGPGSWIDALEAAREDTSRTVTLSDFPPTLWLAATEHHDALLRELVLYRSGDPAATEDLAAAVDRARAAIGGALDRALERARRSGRARNPLPPGHPAELESVPPELELRVPVTGTSAADFFLFQNAIEEAQRLAGAGLLLVQPALVEVVAVAQWAAEQMIAALTGQPLTPWPGIDPAAADDLFPAHPAPDPRVAGLVSGDRTAIVVDAGNRIVGITESLADELGWKADDLVGRLVVALVPPRYREAHTAGFARHLTTGEARALGVDLDLPVLAADGTEHLYRLFLEADRDGGGPVRYVAWLTRIGPS